jgi:hypothetical protein
MTQETIEQNLGSNNVNSYGFPPTTINAHTISGGQIIVEKIRKER